MNDPISHNKYNQILGIDESGKGDFFGPLVIAGVLTDAAGADELAQKNIRDSKKISDNKILELSRWITERFIHSVVVIGPEKYNQLYAQIKNLNRLLAWGHSRVIENIAADAKIDLAVSDKFGRTDFIERALMDKGRNIKLVQMIKGENVIQVAAGSILARAAFVNYMSRLSSQYGLKIPKGAGTIVDDAARKLVSEYGAEILGKLSKTHFKNFKKVIG